MIIGNRWWRQLEKVMLPPDIREINFPNSNHNFLHLAVQISNLQILRLMVVILRLSSLSVFHMIMWTPGKKTGVDLEFLECRNGMSDRVTKITFFSSLPTPLLEIFPEINGFLVLPEVTHCNTHFTYNLSSLYYICPFYYNITSGGRSPETP